LLGAAAFAVAPEALGLGVVALGGYAFSGWFENQFYHS
jgi:hypothetical protein